MSNHSEVATPQRKSFRYWSMYLTSILILVFPTFLITLGLSGLCSALLAADQTEFLPPSAMIASFAVCMFNINTESIKKE